MIHNKHRHGGGLLISWEQFALQLFLNRRKDGRSVGHTLASIRGPLQREVINAIEFGLIQDGPVKVEPDDKMEPGKDRQ